MTLRHSLSLFFFSSLFVPSIALAESKPLSISEIQIAGVKADDEFIRLYNATDAPIDLIGFKLSKKSVSNGVCKESVLVSEKGFVGIIRPRESFLISHPSYKEKYGANLTYSSASYYITDNTTILLYDTDRKSIDRKAVGNACDEEVSAPTPDETLVSNYKDIRINEIFPNPLDEDEEWIELFNFGSETLSLKGWVIADRTKSYPFTDSDAIAPKEFLILSRAQSDIALNNADETITLSDDSKRIVHQISYEKTIEGASLNYSSNGYRWSKIITPSAINILNGKPETQKADIPETTFPNVLTSFSASGKDNDHEEIKYVWDFGDGHKSYKQRTTHRYEKRGVYEGILTVTDGTEESITEFTVRVEKYEAPKIRIASITPNPSGEDTETESIEIENRSRKSVDLLGWSIATGWKKLINHPVRESFIIPKRSKRFLTREFSSFTLPNEKGRIELRSPDGKTVQKIKYNLKGKSAEEDARFAKEKGRKWAWISPQSTDNNKQATNNGEQEVDNRQQITENRKQGEEVQLQKDTEIITLKKEQGERLLSTEKNPQEEMRKLISFGTKIKTPIAILDGTPRVAGVQSETPPSEVIPEDFSLNAVINDWLAR